MWVCTKDDIDWFNDHGIESVKLEYILFKLDNWYDAHDAINDCFAVIKMMEVLSETGMVQNMIDMTNKKLYNIYAYGAPFAVKDELKNAGFKWNSKYKVWAIDSAEKVNVENHLKIMTSLYPNALKKCEIESVTGNQRFEVY